MSLKIKKLTATSGYLENAPLEFSDGLNCIIGARGTCKSTIVETIRFLFDADKDKIKQLISEPIGGADSNQFRGLISATLSAGIARCTVVDGHGDESIEVVIERDINSGESRIFRDNVKEISDKRILNNVEIYSQGDLQKIAESGEKRLELIDKHHKASVDKLNNDLVQYKTELISIGQELKEKKILIENRRAEIKTLPIYQQQLSQLKAQQPEFNPELLDERELYTERMKILRQVTDVSELYTDILSKVDQLIQHDITYKIAADELISLNVEAATPIINKFINISSFLNIIESNKQLIQPTQDDEIAKLVAAIEGLNDKYYNLRQAQQDVNESLKQQDMLLKQISYLEEIQKELEEIIDAESILIDRRKILRIKIEKASDEIYNLRLTEVEKINCQFSDNVILTLKQSALCHGYRDKLINLLAGSRLRNREEIASDIANNIAPSDLVDMVECGDSQRLSSLLDRDLSQMARLVSFLLDNNEFYEIEGETFADELEIQLFIDNVPKRVDQLSKGQKATALLPLILRDAPYPLIFDQPEDDLDNRFICETLISDGINKLKHSRQLIFVTHNANIPVLGDAENVIVMTMKTPHKADVPHTGDVENVKEDILRLLEGGEEAFNMRRQKYNI
jgi:DNA repair ATPase RecN